MSVTLYDDQTNRAIFRVNFWHWRAIVEAINRLDVLPRERIEAFHEPFWGALTQADARIVAVALRERLLPIIGDRGRLLIDGQRTADSDDGIFHRSPDDQFKNYGTNARILGEFAECCATCNGFRVG